MVVRFGIAHPIRSTETAFLERLQTLRKEGKITEEFYNKVRPSEGSSKQALFYGPVKLHKPSARLRPVVATRGTATYALARELSRILRPLVGCSGRALRKTIDLVDKLDDVVLRDDEMFVSYDVKSLFTSIPVEESIQVCEKRLIVDNTLSQRTQLDVPTIIHCKDFWEWLISCQSFYHVYLTCVCLFGSF